LLNAGIIVFCHRFWMFTSPSEAKVKLSADPQSTADPPPVPAALLVALPEPPADAVPEPEAAPVPELAAVPEPDAEPVPEPVAVPELAAGALLAGDEEEVFEPELLLELQAATVRTVVRMAAAARSGLVRISAPRLCVDRDRPVGVRRSAGLASGPYRG
jgi:hypothetical protein